MVTTASKRSLSRMKVKSAEISDCLPFLTITADHHIIVLGKNLTEAEGSSHYREFSSLRYHSRPGDAGSFFATPTNEANFTNSLPCIPAIMDTKNDRVYAMQQGNKKLTCWDSWKSSGPDEKSTLKIHLKYPAISMTLLPMSKGIIYGSCRNGVIYVARVFGEAISVEYLQVNQPKGAIHVGTFAEIEAHQANPPGRKRKMSEADGYSSSVNFYQIFYDGVLMKIVRNNVSLSISNPEKVIKTGSLIQDTASVSLLNDELSDHCSHYALDRVELLISSSSSAPKISVVYTVSKTSSSANQNNELQDPCCGKFCAAISIANGELSNSPVRLPSQTTQFGLIAESVLAAASSEVIYLFDLVTGSTLQSNSLKRILGDIDGDRDWVLHTNDKHGILSLCFQREDHLHVALSTATLDESKVNLCSNKLKSSTKLACSLLACPNANLRYDVEEFDQVCNKGTLDKNVNSSSLLVRMDKSVARALTTLEKTRQMAISEDAEASSAISFREAFDTSLIALMKDVNNSDADIGVHVSTDINPQGSSNGELGTQTKKVKNEKINGRFHSSFIMKANDRKIPTCIPQSFIDKSVHIVLSIILREKKLKKGNKLGLDARHILKDLIQSKRVSARLHFEGSYALQETGKVHPLAMVLKYFGHASIENPLSALQMIVEMIVNCTDLSERHLVIMLDYMMRHAKAGDIIDTVRYHHAETVPKEYALVKCHEKKTVVAGVRAVLQMIVGYSECNEAMLRVALVEELSSSAQSVILARMLPNLLTANAYNNRAQHFVRSACQWIAALSESFAEDLSRAKTSSGQNYLSLLLNSIEHNSKNSQAVMSLKDSIGVAEMINKRNKLRSRKGLSEAPQIQDVWGYSIDHIIF